VILVTVGTYRFDELVRQVDELAGAGLLPGPVVGQIGSGSYVPHHFAEAHRRIPDLRSCARRADLIISHGGMTVFEMLRLGKRVIGVANSHLADNHQEQTLSELAGEGYLIWCRNLPDMLQCVRSTQPLRPYRPTVANLAENIRRFIL